jgi:two-component system LytT family sensor kinase
MEQLLVVLLVKLVVAASLASILARFPAFQALLLNDERTLRQRLEFCCAISAFCAAASAVRVFTGTYVAADISLEGSLVTGIMGGYISGLLGGVLISLPATIAGHEFLATPLYAAVGVFGGLLRDLAPEPEEIWRFSPFFDLSIYRLLRYPAQRLRSLYHLAVLLGILLTEAMRYFIPQGFGARNLFTLYPAEAAAHPLTLLGHALTTVFCVALPIKIWSSARNERLLESKERLLTEARLAALAGQINPHFLFNTLNTVSSLIRTNPDQARRVVHTLSRILRRLLAKPASFAPLRDEIKFIEDYLSIEMARFGDKLRFQCDIAPDTLDRPVPAMLLQPLVENSIKHGIAPKLDGGVIRIESRLENGRLLLRVADDGVGIEEPRLARLFDQGIGISNVNERLRVLFGAGYQMRVDSRPGEGTRTEIDLPATVQ